MKIDKRTNNDL